MAKKRYISDIIWSDNWFENLQAKEKLLFIYLLTNQQVSICGIYEISLKKIEFETGISKKEIEVILHIFEECNKIFYNQGFIVIINFIKNQGINNENDNLFKGVKRELEEIGLEKLKSIINYKGLVRALQGACKAVQILNLTLLNSTLLNSTLLNSNENTQENENSLKENKDLKIEEKEKINKYGEFQNVKMTEKEYNSLIFKFKKENISKLITNLDVYIGQKGNKYKSHYMTLINWAKREGLREYTQEDYDKDKKYENIGEEFDFIKTKRSIGPEEQKQKITELKNLYLKK